MVNVNGENIVRYSLADLFHILQGYTIQNDTDLFIIERGYTLFILINIKFSEPDAFLESLSSDTLKANIFGSQIIKKNCEFDYIKDMAIFAYRNNG